MRVQLEVKDGSDWQEIAQIALTSQLTLEICTNDAADSFIRLKLHTQLMRAPKDVDLKRTLVRKWHIFVFANWGQPRWPFSSLVRYFLVLVFLNISSRAKKGESNTYKLLMHQVIHCSFDFMKWQSFYSRTSFLRCETSYRLLLFFFLIFFLCSAAGWPGPSVSI